MAVFLVNLKPVKMRGIMSEGMIMCASSPDKVEVIVPPATVEIGDRVTVEGYPGLLHDSSLTQQQSPRLWCAVWCSGNALVSINAVALHRARLVLGWVTAFGQVNCLIT